MEVLNKPPGLTAFALVLLGIGLTNVSSTASAGELYCHGFNDTTQRCEWDGNAFSCADASPDLAGLSLRQLEFADVDGDGIEDMIPAVYSDLINHRVCYGDGAGDFSCESFAKGVQSKSMSVDSADLDGDGDLDLVFGGWGSLADSVDACMNDGQGGFACAPVPGSSVGGSNLEGVSAADFDGDGDADLAIAQRGALRYCVNDGGGSWSCAAPAGTSVGNLQGVDTADVDGDGAPDIVYASRHFGAVPSYVCLNDFSSGGTFDCSSLGAGNWDHQDTDFADFDGDGNLDMAVANRDDKGPPSQMCLGDGNGGFSCSTLSLGARNYFVSAGDYDEDGDADTAWIDGSGALRVCDNDGSGAFSCRTESFCANGYFVLMKGEGVSSDPDTDGDGLLDSEDVCDNDAPTDGNDIDDNGCSDVAADGTTTVTFDGEIAGTSLDPIDVHTENGVDFWVVHGGDLDATFTDIGDGDIALYDSIANSSGTPVRYEYADGSPIMLVSVHGYNRGTGSDGIRASCYIDGVRVINQVNMGAAPNGTTPENLTSTDMDGVACDYIYIDQLGFLPSKDGVVASITFSKGGLDFDTDGDGINDLDDNCPLDPNMYQTDTDFDGDGDACDLDDDDDSVADVDDNCPDTVNVTQADLDGDNIGDACDADVEGDGVNDDVDNCPLTVNTSQDDTDGDGDGDACDLDDDDDTVADGDDNCPLTANAGQGDNDGDGQGDACDGDDDNDGVTDGDDNCPLTANSGQDDTDADGDGDACDSDDDDDGVADSSDNCQYMTNPDQSDLDGDGLGDVCDADLDGDGAANASDNCPLTANSAQTDTDGDGDGNACDDDDDGDGVPDDSDNCPLTANSSQADNEGDGQGDACDPDDDDDGVADNDDNCPLTANSDQLDFDGDADGDACDSDVDGDGIGNNSDVCSETPVDEIVDGYSGCSIEQLCPCEGPRGTTSSWKNHGQYNKCISHSAESLVEQGLITEDEKDAISSEAGQSGCGHKSNGKQK